MNGGNDIIGEVEIWKALGHPIRQRIRCHLDEHGPATSTVLAEALGLNTGTTSYHLRVLARAGLVEDVPQLSHGKERWWKQVPVSLREPAHDPRDARTASAANGRRSRQLSDDLALLQRLHDTGRDEYPWAGISRATLWLTAEQSDQLRHDYESLLATYSQEPDQRAVGARRTAVRMFCLPTT